MIKEAGLYHPASFACMYILLRSSLLSTITKTTVIKSYINRLFIKNNVNITAVL